MPKHRSTVDGLIAKCARTELGCWEWPGAEGGVRQVRRRIFNEMRHPGSGEATAWGVTNRCGNKRCVNPEHQEDVVWQSIKPENLAKHLLVDVAGCWLWQGKLLWNGYGYFVYERRTTLVHRFLFEQALGPIPDGRNLDHLCRNRGCCNPAHLEIVTPRENSRRGLRGVLKTHCKNGHEYTTDNIFVNARGARECRECRRVKFAKRDEAKRLKNNAEGRLHPRDRTRCPQGHEYTPENTYIYAKTGERQCRECGRRRAREAAQRNKAEE